MGVDGAGREMSPMVMLLAGMPDLWMRELGEHRPDDGGFCLSCRSGRGRARWPCLPRRIAERAADAAAATGPAGDAGPRMTVRPDSLARPEPRHPRHGGPPVRAQPRAGTHRTTGCEQGAVT